MKVVFSWTEIYTCLLFTLLKWCQSQSTAGIKELKYIRQTDQRSSVSYRQFPCVSATRCCAVCAAEEPCYLVSYMAQEGLCELTDALPGGTTVAMDTEIGWNIYYSAGTCESGWHTHGASCYLFQVAAKQNWDLAQVACQNNSGHLVYIETGPEMETLTQIMTDHYPGDVRVWIGARDNGNGVFLWGDRTTLSGTFMNWDRDQPNSASENCAEINSARGYRWNDKECDAALNYICEKENV